MKVFILKIHIYWCHFMLRATTSLTISVHGRSLSYCVNMIQQCPICKHAHCYPLPSMNVFSILSVLRTSRVVPPAFHCLTVWSLPPCLLRIAQPSGERLLYHFCYVTILTIVCSFTIEFYL